MKIPRKEPRPLAFAAKVLLPLLVFGAAASADEQPIPDEIVELRVADARVLDEASLEVMVRATIAKGWHVNAHEPTLPELIPTVLEIELPEGWSVVETTYPDPVEYAFAFAGGKKLAVYDDEADFVVRLGAGEWAAPGEEAGFVARLHYQACDDTRCLRPDTVERDFVVRTPAAAAPGPAASSAAVPPEDERIDDWLSRFGLLPTLGFIALMGLGLNLTPCVYPLLSVTIAYFGGQTGQRRSRTLLLAGVYVLGIALTFSALGVMAALTGGLFGGLLQHPATLWGLAAILVALALSNFGLYTIRPPARLLDKTGQAGSGVLGALFMGLTMGVVAAPCVGPIVVGLLVTVAAKNDPVFGFTLFFILALGMGAPYVALAMAAGSIDRLPRSGEWLAWVEHFFGFVLVGLALYFLMPVLPAGVYAGAWVVYFLVTGVVLGFVTPHGRHLPVFRWVRRGVGAAAIALAATVLALSGQGTHEGDAIVWTPYSADVLASAAENRRPAVIDFRADWCLPCLEMEATTFRDDRVLERSENFAMIQADVTAMSDSQEAWLSTHAVRGVPTTIFLGADGAERHRRVGYVGADEMLELMEKTAPRSGDAEG